MVSAGGDLYTVADGLHAARGLIKHARDPFTTTNLLNISTHIAVLLARYGQALDLAGELLAEASASGLDFAADHALVDRLAALVGQRKLSAAQATLNTLQEYADRSSPVVEWSTYLQAIRLRTALGDLARASSLLEREAPKSLPMVTLGEYLAQRGLVATALGDYRAAETAFDGARKCRGVSNTAFLCRLGDAALRLRRTDGESSQTCVAALLAAFECGHLDAVVTAVRAVPELICAGASDPRCARALTQILHASCDIDLGRRAGLVMARELRPRERLSPRERDVYELVVQGRTNKQIANTLFISESTTKVHVRHIFEKLGVRTRAEAARFRMPEDVV
jgi:DNA-binding CsgD family transcriptional regulator